MTNYIDFRNQINQQKPILLNNFIPPLIVVRQDGSMYLEYNKTPVDNTYFTKKEKK